MLPTVLITVAVVATIFSTQVTALDVLSKISDTKFNVHIVPHSHDDPGWLKTADQYYSGFNSSIYTASVKHIFNSVVTELSKNGDRTFSFCEVSFFQRWWHEQTPKMKENVRYLFKNGQLSFLNGGWVMHDEASSHYVSMIDQTTLGHRFLLEELDYRPRVGWQIDPFGHSNTHAWLSSEVGFDALYFGRIDYQDRAKRFKEKAMEMVWKGSASDPSAEVFTGAFSDGNYGPPAEFCLDTTCPYCRNDPVETDPLLETYNLEYKIQKMIEGIESEQSITRGNHLMLKLGSDFAYANSQSWYNSLDIIIDAVNARDSRFNLFYSDPTSYTKARAQETSVVWPSKTDDFFPYSDASHTFWTGYFTSRPQFKYFERYSSAFLQIVKQIAAAPHTHKDNVLSRNKKDDSGILDNLFLAMRRSIFQLTAAVGLVNHHDSITGTAKQHVADDYKKILARGVAVAEETLQQWMKVFRISFSASVESDVQKKSSNKEELPAMTTCRMVNETLCTATQSLQVGDRAIVMTYNPLPRVQAKQVVSVLLSDAVVTNGKASIAVIALSNQEDQHSSAHNASMKFIRSELFPALNVQGTQQGWRLVFNAEQVAALSFNRYVVHILDHSSAAGQALLQHKNILVATRIQPETLSFGALSSVKQQADERVRVTNGLVTLTFDASTGFLLSLGRKMTETDDREYHIAMKQDFGYYKSFGPGATKEFRPLSKADDRDPHLQNIQPHPETVHPATAASTQTSGAYIFRPSQALEEPTATCDALQEADCGLHLQSFSVYRGQLCSEVHQQFSSWTRQVLRLYQSDPAVEVEYLFGSVPVESDGIGKEVITRIQTSLDTRVSTPSSLSAAQPLKHAWSTDSNGREFMPRVYNYRPTWDLEVYEPVAGNYYPLTAAMYMVDEQQDLQFSWLTDRSLGGASLTSGGMELMLQRRLLWDDYKGVEEALNETTGGITPYPDWQRVGTGISVRGRCQWLLSPRSTVGMTELRNAMDRLFFDPATTTFYSETSLPASSASAIENAHTERAASTLAFDLPANVQLVSLERLTLASSELSKLSTKPMQQRGDREVLLVRLGHAFAINEDPVLSQPVTIDLAALFAAYAPSSMQELTLSANQDKAAQVAGKVHWTSADASTSHSNGNHNNNSPVNVQQQSTTTPMTVTLQPMQIRTFILTL